jgi:hypothetical protein
MGWNDRDSWWPRTGARSVSGSYADTNAQPDAKSVAGRRGSSYYFPC